MINQGKVLIALGCTLLYGVTAFAAEPPRNPAEAYGPLVRASATPVASLQVQRLSSRTSDTFRYWNTIAVDASGLDHTPVAAGETRTFGEQLGPGRASRAMAIVHIAIFDAVNSILGGYRGYTSLPRTYAPASIDAAIAAAAHDTLVSVYPSQKSSFDSLYSQDLNRIPSRLDREKRNGVAIGKRAAALIIALRANDGSNYIEPRMGTEWIPHDGAGHWRQDPIGLAPIAMGAHWGAVQPFVMRSGLQFRAPAPPAMSSEAYTVAYNEVKRLGGDGVHTATERSAEQAYIGIYWAYDGVPNLCAPPRLYNQVAREISKRSDSVQDLARLFVLVNVSMADAGIAIWESKFYYDVWRPVTGIREADEGTGPGGAGDGNPATLGDAAFFPLGAPPSNLIGAGFTPPFPSYPSGHAGFGGALFETLRNFYRTDRVSFTFVSDEFNGQTKGGDGVVRPLTPRSFTSFSQAEEENGQSRIYLGIHWSFDKTQGIRQGRKIADYVFANAFQPVRR